MTPGPYVDSSWLADIVVREPGTEDASLRWSEASEIACVSIGYLEVRGAIARRLRATAAKRAVQTLDAHWEGVETIAVGGSLIARAIAVIDRHRLRALDALHLAAAQSAGAVVVATRDAELARAAQAVGLAVLA